MAYLAMKFSLLCIKDSLGVNTEYEDCDYIYNTSRIYFMVAYQSVCISGSGHIDYILIIKSMTKVLQIGVSLIPSTCPVLRQCNNIYDLIIS
jgi:hypothetical protein